MKKLLENIGFWRRNRQGASTSGETSPPTFMETQYELLEDNQVIDAYFDQLQTEIADARYENMSQFTAPYFVERGVLSEKRRYFFVQPANEEGWLFERSPYGWTISKAAKIVETQTFLRNSDAWDVVVLFKPDHPDGLVRLSSKRLSNDLICFPIYRQMLMDELALGRPVDEFASL